MAAQGALTVILQDKKLLIDNALLVNVVGISSFLRAKHHHLNFQYLYFRKLETGEMFVYCNCLVLILSSGAILRRN